MCQALKMRKHFTAINVRQTANMQLGRHYNDSMFNPGVPYI